MSRKLIGLDIETYDPFLKTLGWSWKYKTGYVLCTGLYYEEEDIAKVIPGMYNANSPFSFDECVRQNKEIKNLLLDSNVTIVGANLQYDIGWLLYEYGMTTYDVRCSFVDVLQAERLLDEFHMYSLEDLSQAYLHYGKKKDRIEIWVRANVKETGDFRAYLYKAPWDLLCEYVLGDANNPVKIWHKQLTLLKEQNLCKRCKLEFDCILPVLQITINGYPIDYEKKEKNCKILTHYRDLLKNEFLQKCNLTNFNVNSSLNIAAFCDSHHISYPCKITIKGFNGNVFGKKESLNKYYYDIKRLVSEIQFVKGKLVAFVPVELADRTVATLKENNYMVIVSPNVDKKFFAATKDKYPEIDIIANWKLANGIISKILGPKYDRFLIEGNDGVWRIHPQFNITNTKSFRFSSVHPNSQQIPSKGGFTVTENGEKVTVSFPDLTRGLFIEEPDKVLWKIDYGQIEYRLICNIAVGEGAEEVREEFAKNPKLDFHAYVVGLTGLQRKDAKRMSFGVSFGMGLKSMAKTFGWTMEKAEEISAKYHEHMPFVTPTLTLVGDVAAKRGYIRTVYGSHARFPGEGKEYTMLNRYTQGSGAEILKLSIVTAYKQGLWRKLNVHNTIHDELNGSVAPKENNVRDVYEMAKLMVNVAKLRVPLEAEPEFGVNWATTKTMAQWQKVKDETPEEWKKLPNNLKTVLTIADRVRKDYNL